MDYLLISISALIPFICLWISKKISFLDIPDISIKSHSKAIPYVGGISAISLCLIFLLFVNFNIPVLIILLFSLTGTLDDKYGFTPYLRLIIEFILIIILCFFIHNNLSILVLIPLSIIGVSIINAFNFIDIKDGLATSFGICFLLLMTNSQLMPDDFNKFICIYLISLISFYYLNTEPARCYQGDGGTYAMAAASFASILYSTKGLGVINTQLIATESIDKFSYFIDLNKNLILILLILIAIFPIIFEMFFVVFVRIKKNLNPLLASKDHIAIRLSNRGYSTYKISFFFFFLPFTAFILSILNQFSFNIFSLIAMSLFLLVFFYRFLMRL